MRGVTYHSFTAYVSGRISTHTPHARRDGFDTIDDYVLDISTHMPHARRDDISLNLLST